MIVELEKFEITRLGDRWVLSEKGAEGIENDPEDFGVGNGMRVLPLIKGKMFISGTGWKDESCCEYVKTKTPL